MGLSEFKISRLHSEYNFNSFDCGDDDLNEFLLKDSINHFEHLLATTFIIENGKEIVGFFSLLNDKISVEQISSRNKFLRKLPYSKRTYKSYPSVKLGRLGIGKGYQGNKYGTEILDFLKLLFISNNRTGCRYITVDAYKKSINFYQKNQFEFLIQSDELHDTRLMYFDLKNVSDALKLEQSDSK